jgi:hypothetical protein
MKVSVAFAAGLLAIAPLSLRAQGRVVAVIDGIHADSGGGAFWRNKPLAATSLDAHLAALRSQLGATIWFSWSGGPNHRRTPAQEALLARLRASGIRVELRTDSTFRARVVHER